MVNKEKNDRIKLFENIDIYPVITSSFTNNRSSVEVLECIAKSGAKIVQLREKSMNEEQFYELACEYRKITSKYNMLLIINDNIKLALKINADGVHLGQDDMSICEARKLAPNLILGSSTHDKTELLQAQEDGADYINIGPIYSTQTKVLAMGALGLDLLKDLIPFTSIPFTVMGGIKHQHIKGLVSIGASKIAMVTEITQAENITETVIKLRKEFRD